MICSEHYDICPSALHMRGHVSLLLESRPFSTVLLL